MFWYAHTLSQGLGIFKRQASSLRYLSLWKSAQITTLKNRDILLYRLRSLTSEKYNNFICVSWKKEAFPMMKTSGKGLWTGPKVAAPCRMGLSVCATAYTQKVPKCLIFLLSGSIIKAPVNVAPLYATWITLYVSNYPFGSQSIWWTHCLWSSFDATWWHFCFDSGLIFYETWVVRENLH